MRKTILYISVVLSVLFFAASVFFYLKVREQNHYIDGLIYEAAKGLDTDSNKELVIAISDDIYKQTNAILDRKGLGLYDKMESLSFFNMTSAVSLKYGGYGIRGHSTLGPCGTMSRTLLNALWRQNIPARKLQLLENIHGKIDNHTLVEFYNDGRWLVIAPSDRSFVWKNKEGDIATAEEIRKDKDVYAQIFKTYPDYIYLFQRSRNIRWEKLPGFIVKIIRFFMGEERFNNAQTPRLYDMPRTLLLIISLVFAAIFGISTILASKTRKKRH